MTLNAPELKKAMLLGLVAAVVPLFYYPNSFGWQGATAGSAIYLILELCYYVLVFYGFNRRADSASHMLAAGLTFGIRTTIGVVFGLMLAGNQGMSAVSGLSSGLFSYLPFVIPMALMMPFLMRSAFEFKATRSPRTKNPYSSSRPVSSDPERTPAIATQATPVVTEKSAWKGGGSGIPDFGAAVEHVASYSTVELALIVDDEGLCVAKACRPSSDSEMWAPVVNLVYQSIQAELVRTGSTSMKRFELTLATQKLVVERVETFYLAVLFDQVTDELVNVRIAQAIDMIKKYYKQKYSNEESTEVTEVAYV